MEKIMNKNDARSEPVHSFNEAYVAAKENIGPSLKHALVDSANHLSALADEATKQMIAKSRIAGKTVNRNVHSQPWAYIAGAGVLGMTLGYFLVRRK